MKILICDKCASEQKVVKATCRIGWTHATKLAVCKKHRHIGDNLSKDKFVDLAIKIQNLAESFILTL